MISDKDKILLENEGYEIECESPLEIIKGDEEQGRMTGEAVFDFLHFLKLSIKYKKQIKKLKRSKNE